jgi:ABC-type antimicrobial peptide transport system permease subunit
MICVAAVIAMTALGNGASKAAQDHITALGTRLLQVDAARQLTGGIAVQNPVRMTEKDAAYLREHNTRLAEIEPQQDRNVQVLIEAVVLCIVGGLIGAGVGMTFAVVMRSAFGWSTIVGADSILLAVLFSGTV